jgi:hypothetical protein
MSDFSKIGGVGIMGFISPMDTLDTYAVTDPLYGVDGLRNVDQESDLDLISYDRRRPGMIVGVDGGSKYFKLKNNFWSFDISDWEEIFFLSSSQLEFLNNLRNNLLIPGVNSSTFIDRELISGNIDSVNKVFSLRFTPELNSEHLFYNGLLQDRGEQLDYLITGKTITFNEPPKIGSKLLCTYRTYSEINFIDHETPIGVTDGINKVFELSTLPKPGSDHIYLNGLLQDPGENNDYTINEKIITFNFPPNSWSKITCSYRFH